MAVKYLANHQVTLSVCVCAVNMDLVLSAGVVARMTTRTAYPFSLPPAGSSRLRSSQDLPQDGRKAHGHDMHGQLHWPHVEILREIR